MDLRPYFTAYPWLPPILLVLGLCASQALVRKYRPAAWRAVFGWMSPDWPDLARRAIQSVPSAVGGAVITAACTGGDMKLAAAGALVGVFAPPLHHLLKWLPFVPYDGALGR